MIPKEKYNPLDLQIRELEMNLVGRNIDGFFPTPNDIAVQMIEVAGIMKKDSILEPSSGIENIAEQIRKISPQNDLFVIEINSSLREILQLKGFNLIDYDFLKHNSKYDVIIMNPPFEKFQDNFKTLFT